MTHPFSGIRAKLDRAQETANELDQHTRAFFALDPQPFRIEMRKDADGCVFTWRVYETHSPPLKLAVLAGECIHHLRTTLDHIVCALVAARGNSVQSRHKFPMCYDKSKFDEAVKGRSLEGISGHAVSLVEASQPFADFEKNAILGAIHDYDNIDKHRLLPLMQSAVAFEEIAMHFRGLDPTVPEGAEIQFATSVEVRPLCRLTADGEDVLSLTTGRHHPNLYPEAEFANFLAFEKVGLFKREPVGLFLAAAIARVSQVADAFEVELT